MKASLKTLLATLFVLCAALPLHAEPSPQQLDIPAAPPESSSAISPTQSIPPTLSTPAKTADPRASRKLKTSAIRVTDAWMQEVKNAPVPTADVFVNMRNESTMLDTFKKVVAPTSVAESVKLYEAVMQDNKRVEREIIGVIIPQGRELRFNPDNWVRIRLINVKRPLKPKEAFLMRFEFERATPAEMWVEVRPEPAEKKEGEAEKTEGAVSKEQSKKAVPAKKK